MDEKALSLMTDFLPKDMDLIDVMILLGFMTIATYIIERRHQNV